ncbi:MAG: energy-coupling factor ABC transporter permease [Natronomonas sp.]
MHIMEGFLPPIWTILWTVFALPFVIWGARRTVATIRMDARTKALVAVAAAFVFVLSALKLPSVAGSSSHPTGTGLLVVLFGPVITTFVSVIVLLYQSILLGHGGLTTLGANVTSMGIVGPFVGWVGFRLVRSQFTLTQSTFVAAAVTDWTTYLVTSLQLGLAFPTGNDVAGVAAATLHFAAVFAFTQVPIGVLEGILTAAMVGYLLRIEPVTERRTGVLT